MPGRYQAWRTRRFPQKPRLGPVWQRSDWRSDFKDIREVHFLRFEFQQFGANDLSSFAYLIYRLIYFAGFITITVMATNCTSQESIVRFIYFNRWNILIHTFYAGIFALVTMINTFHHCCYRDDLQEQVLNPDFTLVLESRPLGRKEKIVWCLHNIAIDLAFMDSLVFWIQYPHSLIFIGPLEKCGDTIIILQFGATGILALIDGFVCAIPIRVGHMLYSICVGALYVTGLLIYEFADGEYYCREGQSQKDCQYIYPFFNWSQRPGHAALSFLAYPLIPGVVHGLYFLLYKLRLLVLSKTCKKDAFLDHQYPFLIETTQVETSLGYYGVTDPDNPFPRRILINDGIPISRSMALEEVKKVRNDLNEPELHRASTVIHPFPEGSTQDYRAI